jgi:hypothetical protein
MTPAEYQKMIDYLDKYQSHGQIPVHGPCPGNAEIEKEWQIVLLALEAIRCNALAAQVRAVRLSQQAIPLSQEGIPPSQDVILLLPSNGA